MICNEHPMSKIRLFHRVNKKRPPPVFVSEKTRRLAVAAVMAQGQPKYSQQWKSSSVGSKPQSG